MPISNAQLKGFNAVAREGSFTKAAQVSGISQPTLSGHVKELEDRFGVRLFDRHSRSIALTDLGQELFAVTRRMFSLENEAEQLLLSARELVTGALRIGADAPYHVVPLIANFNRRYPGVRLSFEFGDSADVLRALRERSADIVVLPRIPGVPELHARQLLTDRLVVFTDKGHEWANRRSIRVKELESQRLLLRGAGSATRNLFERGLEQAGVVLTDTLEIGSREAVREAVAAGLGIGVVAESEFGTDDRLSKLEIRDHVFEGAEYVACLKEKRGDRVIRAFFELLPEPEDAGRAR